MMEKVSKFLKRLLILGLLWMVGIPLSVIGGGKAMAAEKLLPPSSAKITVVQNPVGQNDWVVGQPGSVKPGSMVEVSKNKEFDSIINSGLAGSDGSFLPISLGDNTSSNFFLRYSFKGADSSQIALANDILPPAVGGLDNLKAATYWQGEKISLSFKTEKDIKVWAEIGKLDKNFPKTIDLGSAGGVISFETPKLTNRLNPGNNIIRIYFRDKVGNSTVKEIPVNLKAWPTPKVVSLVAGEKKVTFAWQAVKGARQYFAELKTDQGKVTSKRYVDSSVQSATFESLQPGTVYSVRVSAIFSNGEIGSPEESAFTTSGNKPITEKKVVAGQENVARVAPQISTGVSTSTQAPVKQIESSPSAEPQQASTANNGWSKLLIALSILIIAAGAAIGGYYGYEWAVSRRSDGEKPTKSDSRW